MQQNTSSKKKNLKEAFKTSDLASRVLEGEEISLRFRYPTDEILATINALLSKILSKQDLIFLLDTVITILRELILNAVKANAKRLFFKKLDLDISDELVYQRGIKIFKESVINDLASISDDLNESEYWIRLKIRKDERGITVSISNNIDILRDELDRINYRIQKAVESADFNEAYEKVYDPTEGAGLGIILSILLLKNAGIDPSCYQILSSSRNTSVSLLIPRELRPAETTSVIKKQIIDEIDALPTFPEHIIQLQALCNDPDSSIDVIASRITADPSLTADILKISNSAGFITGKRIKNVSEAIMIIGLRNLNSILTIATARKIIDRRYKKFEQIWGHCNKTAFYAKAIAQATGRNIIADQVFISGLLHDIGKIVLLSTDQKLINQISDIVANRKIRTSTILEEIAIGISHSSIGALISNKWNFPDYLIEAINFHHSPLDADPALSSVVNIVYLANMLAGIRSGKYTFFHIETEVLNQLGLSVADLQKMADRLESSFEQQSSFF
jgi:putative nucleotidyltransferase with HDIG domain